ncbi:MAG: hypothetical protein GQ574_16100 [Crocinitomix sp.]|nr:hypothetical protein [Crocinitomix sp.]
MLNKLLILFVLMSLSQNARTQDLYPIDSCDFEISDTLDQGCWYYERGMIWTYSSCDIQEFKLMVIDRFGVIVYDTHDINALYYRSEMEKNGFRGTQLFHGL